MQKRLVYVLISMTICVLGITGLQLYWNYQNYQNIVTNFQKEADGALDASVDKEIKIRRSGIVSTFKKWMADTAIMTITCDTANREHQTAFTMKDAIPYYSGEKADQRTIGISAFKTKLGKITPEAKSIFINHFAKIVEDDLRDGTTYFYTQGLGHRLDKTFRESKLDRLKLKVLFAQELRKRKISSEFKLFTSAKRQKHTGFQTHLANAAFRRPYQKELVWASLESPNDYYVREMKWLIISSALLIGITLCCFYYTLRTLLSQYKLVAIKNQFINNMTHEINTPLSSIQITAEALQKFNHDPQAQQKYLSIILYQTQKLNELSNEILETAKLEALDFSRNENVDLHQLLLSIVEEIPIDRRLYLKCDLGDQKMIIKGNKKHLSRSIFNVLENAFKYNLSPKPAIEITLQKTQKSIRLSIKDNGLGIADEYKERIFEQFFRIPTGDIHTIKGYGLGLNYVKKVILQHHGAISVTDNYPSGTEFLINLPTA